MPYCVRCGVKLEKTAKSCPLCSTSVPEEFVSSTEEEQQVRDFSVTREVKVPSRYVAGISTLILLIPISITLIIDVSVNGLVTWSYYAMISIVLFWVLLVQPFIIQNYRVVRSITNDLIATALFLYLIDIKNPPASWAGYPAASLILAALIILVFQYVHKGYYRIILSTLLIQVYISLLEVLIRSEFFLIWSLQTALPILACIALGCCLTVFFIHRVSGNTSWSSGLLALSLVLFFSGCTAFMIEIVLKFSITDISFSGWSLFTGIPLLLLSGVTCYAAGTPRIHRYLKRRFHL